jgi:hypothetical protein
MEFSTLLLRKHKEKLLSRLGKSISYIFKFSFLQFLVSLDLDAWINDPPSESEDESTPNNYRYDNTGLFAGNNEAPEPRKSKTYVEPTTEELEKQRETRKQSERMNPFYLKDTKKTKSTHQV